MPIIDVTLLEGRTNADKNRLIAELTDGAERALKAPRDTIRVIIREVAAANFAVAGVTKAQSAAAAKAAE
ncbi:MAG: tautomerase family protein [Alphaproteobacteria bacterium]